MVWHNMGKTSSLRQKEKQLLISFIKPYKAVSKEAIKLDQTFYEHGWN